LKDLTTILEAEKIANTKIGLRQHFLRWETPDTFQIQENVGISYDTTLGYADKPGFRAGTCYPFYAFNIKTRKELSLIERPLIVMDCTLTAPRYLNLSFDEALQKALKLKNECEKHCGVFTLLWHNTEFSYKDKALLYEQIITGK